MKDDIAVPEYNKKWDPDHRNHRHDAHGQCEKDSNVQSFHNDNGQQIVNRAQEREAKQREFRRLDKRTDFELLKVQLAVEANFKFMKYKNLYTEISEVHKSSLHFILLKYAFVKIMDLKSNFFGKKNMFGEDQNLWQEYTNSPKYYAKVKDIETQVNLC